MEARIADHVWSIQQTVEMPDQRPILDGLYQAV